ncbi:hypothetical protein [Arsenicicoccus sp. oral taxon 190]|uniref:hypothetical protein n=1 Tax=Arsenicicoccus sp. oral taxon 190 TaxID=1658671 RepID=UPI000679F2E9|nr:hypothetical protein [Arsenicicoccus sp. oral taxon 190]AKT52430.1 hypothetical protein ADJ73_16215 [Arsenicicoccus sp. oral taxon 190]
MEDGPDDNPPALVDESFSGCQYGYMSTKQHPPVRFTRAAAEAASAHPQGVSRTEGWYLVGTAALFGACHALLYQTHGMAWGGIIRFAALFLTIAGVTWLLRATHAHRQVHPRGHRAAMVAALSWMLAVVLVAGWAWIVPAAGHDVGWAWTSLVALTGVLPLALVGLRLVRAFR